MSHLHVDFARKYAEWLRECEDMTMKDLISRWNAELPDNWGPAAAVRPGGKGTKASGKANNFFVNRDSYFTMPHLRAMAGGTLPLVPKGIAIAIPFLLDGNAREYPRSPAPGADDTRCEAQGQAPAPAAAGADGGHTGGKPRVARRASPASGGGASPPRGGGASPARAEPIHVVPNQSTVKGTPICFERQITRINFISWI